MDRAVESAVGARRVLILSTTAFTQLFAVWLMFGVLGIPIKKELGLTPSQFGWLTASAILSGSLLRLPLGILTDRIGGRAVLSALLLIAALPCALVAWAHSFTALLALALCFGVAGNSFSLGIAWNSAWFPRERQGVALGTFGAGNVGASVTKLIGPLLIALVPTAGFLDGAIPGGWRFVPLLYSALLVAMAVVVWLLAPAPDRRPGAGRPLAAMLAPLANLRVWRFGLYYVVVFGAYVALSLWLPNYYKEVYGLPLASAALLTTLFIFPASLLRPLGGWLSDRFGARPVTYATFIAMLAASLPLAAPSSVLRLDVATFTALVCVLGVGMGIGKASVYRYIPDYFPGDVGAVGGLVGTLGALGGFVLPLSFGYLQQATGRPESCFMAVAGLIAVSLLWLHGVVSGIKRRERDAIRLAGATAATAA
jgi:NNP family nitrate/nitrite transporter-like MFS transporter